MTTVLTFGHGTAPRDELCDLLPAAGVRRVVDVRRFPGSRRHPHVATTELEQWLPAEGIGYRWDQRLGGRRALPADAEPTDPWWRVEAFRAYAAHTRTPEFRSAIADLLAEAAATTGTAVMCSESLWWRCHRRLIADVLVLLHSVDVVHLGHDGRLIAHPPAAGARISAAGVVYDRAGPSAESPGRIPAVWPV